MKQIDWAELIGSARVSAVHMEMRDSYAVKQEAEEFERWRSTGIAVTDLDSPGWADWSRIIRDAVSAGVVVRRVRIVSEPITEYARWLHATTGGNLASGELVRWLPRARASDLALPGNDFWVIDDHTVLFNHFTGDGDWAEEPFELRHEPAVIKLCSTAFDAAWERAVDHADYQP